MYRLLIIFLVFFHTFVFAQQINKVSIQLNWKHQFEFAGIYAAKEKGFYKDVNLDVQIKDFDNKTELINDVKNGLTTFGLYDLSLLSYYETNKPIVLLANFFKKSGLIIISKQDIFTPFDLKGKTILASKNQLENSILSSMLDKFHISTKDFKEIIPHDFRVDKFINGEVDALTAYISNELYYIKKNNIPFNILDPSNYGHLGYSENLFTSKDFAKSNPLITKNFIEATKKGWKYALANKSEIIDLIYNKYSKLKDKEALLFEAKEVEKLIMPSVYPIGSIEKRFIENILRTDKLSLKTKNDINIDELIFSYNKNKKTSILTKQEIKYLKNKKEIKVCIDPNWMPYEKYEKGVYFGISKDYMEILQKSLQIPINLYPTKDWHESLQAIKEKKCDILSLIAQTKSREKSINFTSSYLNTPVVITTKVDEMFISKIEDIINKESLGVVKNYAIAEVLRNKYPNNKIVEVKDVDTGLEKIVSGEIFGFIGTLSTIGYKIQNNFLGELKIAGKLDEVLNLSIGVRNDDLMLLHILDKSLLNISNETKHEILNRWINVKFEKGFDYSLVWKIIIFFALIALIFIYRHSLVLKNNKEIKKQQEKLKKKNLELEVTSKKLEDTLEGFQILLNSTMEAVFVFEDGYCLDANDSGVKLFGFKNKEEFLGEHIKNFIWADQKETVLKNLANDTQPYEISMIKKDGTVFPAYVQGRNAVLNGRKIRISTALDISELKHQEKLLLQQSKMASLGEMIGNIAHQWRQPLSLISTIATSLKFKIEINEFSEKEAINGLGKLNDTVQHLSKTIDDFRNFFSMNKESVTFNLKDLLYKNFNLLENILKINEINLIINCDESLELTTYKNELLQVFLNILNNSCDALQNIDNNRVIFVDVSKKEDLIFIKIKDNGLGLAENIMDKIFEPYFTTKHQASGTGIGLYMTHQIITKHIKGKIFVENISFVYKNEEQVGALFVLEIPVS